MKTVFTRQEIIKKTIRSIRTCIELMNEHKDCKTLCRAHYDSAYYKIDLLYFIDVCDFDKIEYLHSVLENYYKKLV